MSEIYFDLKNGKRMTLMEVLNLLFEKIERLEKTINNDRRKNNVE